MSGRTQAITRCLTEENVNKSFKLRGTEFMNLVAIDDLGNRRQLLGLFEQVEI